MRRLITRFSQKCSTEWERTILVLMVVVGVLSMAPALRKIVALMEKQPKMQPPSVRVESEFSEGAFAFLGKPADRDLLRDHIFVVNVPRNWRPPRPPRKHVVTQIKPPPKPPKPPKPPPPPPPPPPPLRVFYAYKGYYSRPGGPRLAYLIQEHLHGNKPLKSKYAFLGVGDTLGDYEVVEFTDQMVLLRHRDSAETKELSAGERFQVAVITDPAESVLQRLQPPQADDVPGRETGMTGEGGEKPKGRRGKGRRGKKRTGKDPAADAFVAELKKAGINVNGLRKSGLNIEQIRKEGIDLTKLREQGVRLGELRKNGVSFEDIMKLQRLIKERQK